MRGELLEAERVHSIVGGFFAVYNYYGYGLSERVYAGALEHELRARGHELVRELMVDVSYRGQHVAWQRLDMVVDERVVVENKATEKLSPADRNAAGQLLTRDVIRGWAPSAFRPHPTFRTVHRLPQERAGTQRE